MTDDNSFAGQGAVVLDIGGNIGALVVHMPVRLEGYEVGIRPAGDAEATGASHRHDDAHGGIDHQGIDQHHRSLPGGEGTHTRHDHEWPHVGVVARRAPAGIVHSAVFGHLRAGRWALYLRPDGPVELEASVVGGHVAEVEWPS